MIYHFASSNATLTSRASHSHLCKARLRDWHFGCRFNNTNKNLLLTCRQIRNEVIGLEPKPYTLIIPFNVDLEALLHIGGSKYFSEVETVKMVDQLAVRFRGLSGGNYRGFRVEKWGDRILMRQTFPKVGCVVVKGVGQTVRCETEYAVRHYFGNDDVEVVFG